MDGCFGLAPPGGDALNAAASETVSLIALLAVLAWAVIRPRGWPEAVAAVPAAVILIAAGAIPAGAAGSEARQLGPVIGFLAAILVLAHLCGSKFNHYLQVYYWITKVFSYNSHCSPLIKNSLIWLVKNTKSYSISRILFYPGQQNTKLVIIKNTPNFLSKGYSLFESYCLKATIAISATTRTTKATRTIIRTRSTRTTF